MMCTLRIKGSMQPAMTVFCEEPGIRGVVDHITLTMWAAVHLTDKVPGSLEFATLFLHDPEIAWTLVPATDDAEWTLELRISGDTMELWAYHGDAVDLLFAMDGRKVTEDRIVGMEERI